MCRHLAYLGPPTSLGRCSSTRRTRCTGRRGRPRRQRHGTVNADGFGIGWYAAGRPGPSAVPAGRAHLGRPVAARHRAGHQLGRRCSPRCAQPRGHGARTSGGRAVRSRPVAVQPQRAAGGRTGRRPRPALADAWPTARPAACLEALTDSALLWALALQRLRRGCRLAPHSPEPSPRHGGGRYRAAQPAAHRRPVGRGHHLRRHALVPPDRRVRHCRVRAGRRRPWLDRGARAAPVDRHSGTSPRLPLDDYTPTNGKDVRTEGIFTA